MRDYQEEIQRGMAWLDEKRPGWPELVDPNGLNMSNGRYCILGQVFGAEATDNVSGYRWAEAQFPEMLIGPIGGPYGMERHGFCVEHAAEFALLTEEWKEALRARVPA